MTKLSDDVYKTFSHLTFLSKTEDKSAYFMAFYEFDSKCVR